jgi:hypothetical protein
MKLSDFIMLNEEEKKLAVVHLAILISKRKTRVLQYRIKGNNTVQGIYKHKIVAALPG